MRVHLFKICTSWPVLLSVLILTISAGILVAGIDGMLKYRHATGQTFDYGMRSIHFYTKEFLKREYQKITAKPLPKRATLPSFHLFVDEKDLESLEENLPTSAKLQYKQSHIKIDDPAFSGKVLFRYRGGLPLHWLYDKKSIRVKLPPFNTYRNERRFDLINFPSMFTVLDWISYDMARSIGLLTPDYFPARVFINNTFNGLHFFLSSIDESFLRKNNRMPGSIYSGDTQFIADPFGVDFGIGEQAFIVAGGNGLAALWTDERLWKKDASKDAASSNYRADLKKFFHTLEEKNPLIFMQAFDTYFEKQKFYLFWGLDKLVGSYHHDLFHNHRIYFDPYKGKFEPIEWDIRFWSKDMPIPVTPLFKQILLNPILKYEHDATIYQLWNKFSVEHISDKINDANNRIKDELAADPYRQYSDVNNKYFGLDKGTPFSMDEYTDSIKNLKQIYKIRHLDIGKSLNNSLASYLIEEISAHQLQVTVAINGNSPVDFDPWTILPASIHKDIGLYRLYKDKTYPVLGHVQVDRLYPGVAVTQYSDAEKMVIRPISFGNNKYTPSPLYYRYLIKGANSSDIVTSKELTGNNAITAKVVTIKKVDTLADDSLTQSLHPWALLEQATAQTKNNTIILSGEIEVYYDHIYNKDQQVTILPGTVFKLYNNTSLYFYGKLTAKGTATSKIVFKRMIAEEPWGSIVLQGKEASESYLSYLDISGGSVALRNLIHYPGQLNIHDVDAFTLEHCYIGNNSIGDDALHIAYSQGNVQDCKFYRTAFDAIDIDISDVSVSNSEFFDIGNDAIDLMNSKAMIDHINVVGSGDKCISVGEASQVTIQNSQLKNCQLGIAVKDQSTAEIKNIKFSLTSGNAIALYRKNPRYSKGGEIQGSQLFGITEKDIHVGDYSINNIKKGAYQKTILPEILPRL